MKMSSAKWRPFSSGLNVLSHAAYSQGSAQPAAFDFNHEYRLNDNR